jgi:hypothetical protein
MSVLRLIRIAEDRSLHFEDFIGEDIPCYAILSHRWIQGEELSFQEMRDGSGTHKAGYLKAVAFAQKAFDDGYKYAWMDTCC